MPPQGWGTLAATLEEVELPSLDPGLAWDASGLHETGRITAVPQPSALAVLGLGLAAALVHCWRQDPARTQEP
ncbi:MAG: PEP-CTERM sorting domain-containing protein [Planctomycetes bacterium]|nr:PEP-CTERM sorting domain-containing protein [Planctomycetota bacterium]